jgi:hypothetical protein
VTLNEPVELQITDTGRIRQIEHATGRKINTNPVDLKNFVMSLKEEETNEIHQEDD